MTADEAIAFVNFDSDSTQPQFLMHGMAIQGEPMKPTLTVPGPKRLQLSYDAPPSKCGATFNLRRYIMAL
jgi:hypothetical protein